MVAGSFALFSRTCWFGGLKRDDALELEEPIRASVTISFELRFSVKSPSFSNFSEPPTCKRALLFRPSRHSSPSEKSRRYFGGFSLLLAELADCVRCRLEEAGDLKFYRLARLLVVLYSGPSATGKQTQVSSSSSRLGLERENCCPTEQMD